MSSFVTSLSASAMGWSAPWKPTRIGPMRIWMRAKALRSNQVRASTITDRNTSSPVAAAPYSAICWTVTGPPRRG